MNNENNNEFVSNCLALTIRKDYRLTILLNIINTIKRVSFKIAFNVGILNFFYIIF